MKHAPWQCTSRSNETVFLPIASTSPASVTLTRECFQTTQAPATEKLCIHIVSYRIQQRHVLSRLQQSLSSQLDLPRSLSRLETAFAHACHATVAKLDLVFNFGECARAVVREVNAAECVRAEVLVAMG